MTSSAINLAIGGGYPPLNRALRRHILESGEYVTPLGGGSAVVKAGTSATKPNMATPTRDALRRAFQKAVNERAGGNSPYNPFRNLGKIVLENVRPNAVAARAAATGEGATAIVRSAANAGGIGAGSAIIVRPGATGAGIPARSWEWAHIIAEIPPESNGGSGGVKGFLGKALDFLKKNKKTAIIATAVTALVTAGIYLYNRNKTSEKAKPIANSNPVQELANQPVGGVMTANGPYSVAKGDNIWNIARAHLEELNKENKDFKLTDVDIYHHVEQIMQLNNLHYEKDCYRVIIKPEQVLKLQ